MTTDELVDSINGLTQHIKIMSGVDGNTGNEIDGARGYYAIVDVKGNIGCYYSSNGYARSNVFTIDLDSKQFRFSKIIIYDDESDLKKDTAKLLKLVSEYLEERNWLPTKEFRQKRIDEIQEKINGKNDELKELQDKLDVLKGNN